MKHYRLDPDKLKEQSRNIILMYGITLVVLLVMNYFMYRGREINTTTILMFGLIVVMFVVVGWNAIRQRKTLWDEYELIVDETGVKQRQPKAAEAFVPRAEITNTKESKFGLTLMVKDGQPVMGIPKLLKPADYEEIKQTINDWLRDSKPMVLDVTPLEASPEESEPDSASIQESEDQQPPELPEV